MDRGATGEVLPASQDDIDIGQADLDTDAGAAGHFGRVGPEYRRLPGRVTPIRLSLAPRRGRLPGAAAVFYFISSRLGCPLDELLIRARKRDPLATDALEAEPSATAGNQVHWGWDKSLGGSCDCA
jgi:hypothetical protein